VDYLEEKLRKDIANDIKYLDLPPDWKPDFVIRYIVRMIENE
jgi:hypothetical protein